MLKLRKVAITGGVASGKSTVAKLFQDLGAFIVDTDAIARDLLNPHTSLGRQIISEFGSDILENGQMSRALLAKKVFQSRDKLEKLEKLLHPEVFAKVKAIYDKISKEQKYSFFVVEIPLLFEINKESEFDWIIAVLVDEKQAKRRFEKQGFTDYQKRMDRQIDPKEKAKRAHFVIQNDGSYAHLKQQVFNLHHKLLTQ